MKAIENLKNQTRDSDTIFDAISSGSFDNFDEAREAVAVIYYRDPKFSRSGIAHALGRLVLHYEEKARQA